MSLRNLIIALALFTIVNAYPAEKPTELKLTEKSSYSTLPLFSLFKPIIELFPSIADIGPKIEIGDKYTNIIIKAEQYKVEELIVEIKGRYVSIEGSRKTVQDDRDLSSEFLYTASLPHNANTSDVFAKFYGDSYLVVTMPNKGLNRDIVHVDRIVPIIVSEDKYIKTEENDDKIQVTTVHREEATEKTTKSPTTPLALEDPIVTTTMPEEVTEIQRITTQETKEMTVEPMTTEIMQTSFDVTNPPNTLEEKVAETESDIIEKVTGTEREIERTTPYIEAVTENAPYIQNEISDLESTTSSI